MDAPDFKPVYILGAGASAWLGAPLLKNFLLRAREQRFSPTFPKVLQEYYDTVFEYQADLFQSRRYLGLDFDNLETLFSILDMDCHIAASSSDSNQNNSRNHLQKVRKALFVLVVETLRLSMTDHAGYTALIRNLAAHPASTFITLNYDRAIEEALESTPGGPLGPSYRVSFGALGPLEHPEESVTWRSVLKLHGSVDWTWCPNCLKFVVHREYIPAHILESSALKFHNDACSGSVPEPVLVPPTWQKSSTGSIITHVWKNAIAAMGKATHLFLVGYSMPRTDSFFDQILALSLRRNQNLKRVVVINPSESLRSTMDILFDKHYADRCVTFLPMAFSDLTHSLKRPIDNEHALTTAIDSAANRIASNA
jgi:hypothetical protein